MRPIDASYREGSQLHHVGVAVHKKEMLVSIDGETSVAIAATMSGLGKLQIQTPDGQTQFHVVRDGQRILIAHEGAVYEFHEDNRAHAAARVAGDHEVRAPMTGRVVDVLVTAGDHVEAGTTLVVLEAMKMEHRMKAAGPMTVSKVHVIKGGLVELGAELVTLVPREAS